MGALEKLYGNFSSPTAAAETDKVPNTQTIKQPSESNVEALTPSALDRLYGKAQALPGESPNSPIKDSPLSLAEQAQLGWFRNPKEQLETVGKHYEDAKLVSDGQGSRLIVKHQGQWHEANNDFEWKFNLPAAAAGATVGFVGGGPLGAASLGLVAGAIPGVISGAKELPAELAFDVGRYGLRSAAAAGTAAAAVGVLPAAVPAAAALGIGALASGVGASSVEGIESASKGEDAQMIKAKMAAGMIFGMEQEIGGKLANKVFKNAAQAFGGALDLVIQNPEGKLAARKLLSMIPGGENDIVVDARLKNPTRNAVFDDLAAKDLMDPQAVGKISKIQNMAIEDIEKSLQYKRNVQRAEFAQLQSNPKVMSSKIDATEPLNQALDNIKGYLSPEGTPKASREFGEGDINALNRLIRSKKTVGKMSYIEARELAQDLGEVLNKGVSNPSIYRAVAQFKEGVQNSIIQGLPKDAAHQYAGVIAKYGPAMDMLNSMEKITDTSTKTSTFIKQIQSDNANASKEFLGKLIDAGVPRDLIDIILQTEGSRKMAVMFAKPGLINKVLPSGAKAQASVINGMTYIRNSFRGGNPGGEAALPYADKAFEVLQKLNPTDRANVLKEPKAIDAIMQNIQNGTISEAQLKEGLLKQGGVK